MILQTLTLLNLTADMLAPAVILWALKIEPEPEPVPETPDRIPWLDIRNSRSPAYFPIQRDLANPIVQRGTDSPLWTYIEPVEIAAIVATGVAYAALRIIRRTRR